MASENVPPSFPPIVGDTNKEIGEKDIEPAKLPRRTPYIRWFGISHPELPPAGTAPTASNPMVNPVPVSLGISPDNKTKRIRNPRVHLINAARIEPLDPGREAVLISLTAYTKEPVPSYEVGKITFWFSLSIPYRKELLIQLVGQGILECTGWGLTDPPALEAHLLLGGDQCSRLCCGCGNWEQLDEPDGETGKRRYKRWIRCRRCFQCFFCCGSCQKRHWGDHSKYCHNIRQAYGERFIY